MNRSGSRLDRLHGTVVNPTLELQESEELFHGDAIAGGGRPLQLGGSWPRPPVETVGDILGPEAKLQRHA